MLRFAECRLADYTAQSGVRQSLTAISHPHRPILVEVVVGEATIATFRERRLISHNVVPNARCVLLRKDFLISCHVEGRYEFYYLCDIEILLNGSVGTWAVGDMLSATEAKQDNRNETAEREHSVEIHLLQQMQRDWRLRMTTNWSEMKSGTVTDEPGSLISKLQRKQRGWSFDLSSHKQANLYCFFT